MYNPVVIDYNVYVDVTVITVNLLSMFMLTRMILRGGGDGVANTVSRCGMGVILFGVSYNVVSATTRLVGYPLDPIYRSSGWAIRDFGIFIYFLGLHLLYWNLGLFGKPPTLPYELRATDVTHKPLELPHQRVVREYRESRDARKQARLDKED